MEPLGYPRRTDAQRKGRVGETYINSFITQHLGWIFRPVHQEDDYGIDGYIDIVHQGNVTGKGLAIQIKCGDSYLEKKTAGGFRYDGAHQHLNFYLNLATPVILMILSADCSVGYWCEFDVGRTEQSGNGWWIEIPNENRISNGVGSDWAAVAGDLHDYSKNIQEFWAFGKALHQTDGLLIAIPQEDVHAKSMDTINMVFQRLCANKKLLLEKRSKVEIFFPDWDDDPRELYEVPEVRNWFYESFDVGIPWFYFINHAPPFNTLRLLLVCGTPISSSERVDGGYKITTNSEENIKWLEANLASLNHFTDSNAIDVSINEEVCNGVMGSLFDYPGTKES